MSACTERGRRARLSLLVTTTFAAIAMMETSAHAGSIMVIGSPSDSTESLGNYSGSLEYNTDSPLSTTGTLIVTLTNTTNPSIGGWLTGFLFDVNTSDPSLSSTLLSSPSPTHPFQTATGNGLSAQPFGNPFDGGAALGGKFLGGGSPTGGIAIGDTGIFHLEISASDAGTLDAIDFLEGGDYDFSFIARFKGMERGEGSDKVPAVFIPVPAPLALGAFGLIGVIIGSRRLRAAV